LRTWESFTRREDFYSLGKEEPRKIEVPKKDVKSSERDVIIFKVGYWICRYCLFLMMVKGSSKIDSIIIVLRIIIDKSRKEKCKVGFYRATGS